MKVDQYIKVIDESIEAQKKWRTVPAPMRGEAIRKFGNKLRENLVSVGKGVTRESKKILVEGIGEVQEVIDMCDFVITVSNTNAHISGALGKDTFLLLPKGKGKLWYWSSHKDRCLWYNSIQIIKQKNIDCWDYPIEKLKKIIKERTNG